MVKFSFACDACGLTISTKKTEVMHQLAPQEEYTEPSIVVNGETLKAVGRFTYLGSTLARNVRISDEVAHRVAKASAAFGKLWKGLGEERS